MRADFSVPDVSTLGSALSLQQLIRWTATQLKTSGVMIGHHADNVIDEARELVLHALHLPEDFSVNYASAKVLSTELSALQDLLRQRIEARIPTAYLTGWAQFAGYRFRTDKRALVPRSPIGELLQERLARFDACFDARTDFKAPRRILDLCTGSGCIGLAAALHFPQAEVWLSDIDADALSLARENCALHRLEARVQIAQSNLLRDLSGKPFDLILSNPPYVTDAEYAAMAGEYRHEPKLGLTSGFDGLNHPLEILRDAPKFLNANGLLILEVGEAERALRQLLPDLECQWLEFSVGPMGIAAITRQALQAQHAELVRLCAQR